MRTPYFTNHNVLQGEYITYKGDPLQDFTTAKYSYYNYVVLFLIVVSQFDRFLDKFVYKNPKQKESGNQ